MTPHQEKILAKLEETPGEYVSVSDLLAAVNKEDVIEVGRWGNHPQRRVLYVQITKMRKELAASGKTIECARGSWSRGYRLVKLTKEEEH